jgi:hypothetical protein
MTMIIIIVCGVHSLLFAFVTVVMYVVVHFCTNFSQLWELIEALQFAWYDR